MKRLLLALLVVACSKPSPVTTEDAGAPAPRTPSSAVTIKSNPVETELLALTKKWNDALAKRDAAALKDVYGANVRLYTNTMTRDAAIKAKTAAFTAAKDYTQSLHAIEIDTRNADQPKAAFDKAWTQNGKQNGVRGSLGFAKEGGKWVVVEESDAPTDEKRAKAAANKDSCEGLVVGVVMSLPEVQAFLAGPTNPSGGHPSNGVRLAGGPPESQTYAVAMHENHDDHLVTFGWYDVDPKSGKVTESALGTEKKPDPKLVEKMKAACK